MRIKCSGNFFNGSPMAIDKGDNIISHALKIDEFFTLGIFHSHMCISEWCVTYNFLLDVHISNLGVHNRNIFQSQNNVHTNKFSSMQRPGVKTTQSFQLSTSTDRFCKLKSRFWCYTTIIPLLCKSEMSLNRCGHDNKNISVFCSPFFKNST